MKKIIIICALVFLLAMSTVTLVSCTAGGIGNAVAPTIAIVNPTKTQSSIGFEILETDALDSGSITKIELLCGNDTPVEASSPDVRSFSGLLSNTKYTVRVTYTYSLSAELSDGENSSSIDQNKTIVKTLDITTEAKEAPVISLINVGGTDSSVGFDIFVLDKDNVGSISKIELLCGNNAPVELTDLTKREFTGLDSNTKYTLNVTYKYNLNDGAGEKTLTATADVYTVSKITEDKEAPSVFLVNPVFTTTSVGFDVIVIDNDNVGAISKIELLCGNNAPVELTDLTKREFTSLVPRTRYTVKVTYKYDLDDGNGEQTVVSTLDISTDTEVTVDKKMQKPIVAIINPIPTTSSIGFDILTIDNDNVGAISKIELLHGADAPVELSDLTKREFTQLLSDNSYTIKVTYKYDLNDGAGEQTIVSSVNVKTVKEETPSVYIIPQTKTISSIGFELLEIDRNNVGSILSIELLHGNDAPIMLGDISERAFTDLLSNNKYTVKVTYAYNLNDGSGEKIVDVMLDILTLAEPTPEIYVESVSSDKSSVSFDILEIDDCFAGEISKIELYKDGNLVQETDDPYVRRFTGLDVYTAYTVKITYKYTLNDGKGEQTREISVDIVTKACSVPVVAITSLNVGAYRIMFNLDVQDEDNVCEIIKIELYKGDDRIRIAENVLVRGFEGLECDTTYTVKVTYSYDIQDGNGEIFDSVTLDVTSSNKFSSKTDVIRDWEGKTLNIACSTWSGTAGAPWSVMELCIDYGSASGFGERIDAAVLERQEFIKETYGVDLNWISATRYSMHEALEQAALAGNVLWDIAMPRAFRVQSIVAGGHIYDMADREFINFNHPYYNANSVEAYTAKGHTFFVAGDFNNLDKETAFVLYFNKQLLGGEQATADLYQMVRDGEWTWNELVTLANGAFDDNGNGVFDEMDTYGFNSPSLTRFYEYFGVRQAGVNESTGEWMIALNDSRVNDIVSAIITANTANWCRSAWSGAWGTNALQAFQDGRLLFCNEVLQQSSYFQYNENLGVVPFPKLDITQEDYYVPCAPLQSVLMCIPKITQDRRMSDYFVDVLSWTGREYTINAYLDDKREHFSSETDIEMLTDYIFPNISYDPGAAVGWGSLMGDVLSDSFEGNVNNFTQAFEAAQPGALQTIASWNNAWGAYTEA